MDRYLLRLAERLGKTKRELLFGPFPLTMAELVQWQAADLLDAKDEERRRR